MIIEFLFIYYFLPKEKFVIYLFDFLFHYSLIIYCRLLIVCPIMFFIGNVVIKLLELLFDLAKIMCHIMV